MKQVKVAVLSSFDGSDAAAERPYWEGTRQAIDYINKQGGVLGHEIISYAYNGSSDCLKYIKNAEEAIKDGCIALFGGLTSESRNLIGKTAADNKQILWYPALSEGFNEQDSIVYSGGCINQTIQPALQWLVKTGYSRFFIIGGYDQFSWTTAKLAGIWIEKEEGKISGTRLYGKKSYDFSELLDEIDQSGCDIIVNLLEGEAGLDFLSHLKQREQGRLPAVYSALLNESALSRGDYHIDRHYACRRYFGKPDRNIPGSAASFTAYSQVLFWKACCEKAESFEAEKIKPFIPEIQIDIFGELIHYGKNLHIKKPYHIGLAGSDGFFSILESSSSDIEATPWLGADNSVLRAVLSKIPEESEMMINTEMERTQYRQLMEHMPSGVAVYKAENGGDNFVFSAINRAAEIMDHVSQSELIGKRVTDIFPGVEEFGLFDVFKRVYQTGQTEHHPISLYKDDSLAGWRENFVYRLPNHDIVAIYRDVTKRKQFEQKLKKTNIRFQLAVDSAGIGVWELNLKNDSLKWDKTMHHLYQVETGEFESNYDAWAKRVHPDDFEKAGSEVDETIRTGKDLNTEFRIIRPDGEIRYIRAFGRVTRDKEDSSALLTGINYDITERKLAEIKLKESALRDPLTGLYNRRYLFERLTALIDKSSRDGSCFSIGMFDIDHFKAVNDNYGHLCGDYVLKQFSSLLNSSLRPYDIAGRYGGEEFVIVLINADKEMAAEISRRILDFVRGQTLSFEKNEINFTFSGGVGDIAECSIENLQVEQLIDMVDSRMYRAKKMGRNRVIS